MTLVAIIVATLASGIGSVWVANFLLKAGLGKSQSARAQQGLLSLAAGALLATAFMHLLPEAFNSEASAHDLFMTLLIGVVFFFLLTKAELWHHGHEHHDHVHHHHDHEHETHSHSHSKGGWSLLTGDSVHCFGDGVLIASAFLADMRLGVIAAVSVLAHEVPHHIGDLVVLRNSKHRNLAVLKVSLAGAVTALGGITGYFLVGTLADWLPYFLVVASSSFVYVALSDLIPQLQKRLSAKESLVQVVWLVTGIVLVTVVSGLAHSGHAH
ncbi:MAG: ZIP family metal transporter [Comamonas sp.]|jgi:zinc and cadmium transporter|nr:ZIP family metal transporter [Comamonas sp.]